MENSNSRPLELPLSLKDRLREIRRGFEPAFWVANVTELFERLAYYAQAAVLAIFLHESLRLSTEQTGTLMGRVWIRGVVSAHPRRQLGGSLRLPQIAGLRLSHARGRIFSDGFSERALDGPVAG